MKITKTRLRQIIKEEISRVREGDDWYSDKHETFADRKFADAQEADESMVGMNVHVVSGRLAGAEGEVIEMIPAGGETLFPEDTGEPSVALFLIRSADKPGPFSKAGETTVVKISDVEEVRA